jgi:hypothetical protein
VLFRGVITYHSYSQLILYPWGYTERPVPDEREIKPYVHYDWHWFWDYGNGDIGNQGVHEMDKARWGLCDGIHRDDHEFVPA